MKHFLKSFIQKFITNSKIMMSSGVLLLIIIFMLSISLGAANLSFHEVWKMIITGEGNQTTFTIIRFVRLPRSMAAILCGSSLAVAGLLLQSALNNALASATTIGVNSGAGLLVVIAAIIFPGVFITRPIFAFIGALMASSIVFLIALKVGVSKTNIILIGIAITSLLSAGIDIVVTFYPESVMDKNAFYIGGFSQTSMPSVLTITPIVIIGMIAVCLLAPQLDLLLLGDEVASSLGMNVSQYRFMFLILASLLAASAICLAGLLSFVGLIVPHMMRYVVGNKHKKLIPLTAIFGAILVLSCDIVARTMFSPYEIPVGIVLSFLGAPFFLSLIIRKKRGINE